MACSKLPEVFWLGLIGVQSSDLAVTCYFLNHLPLQELSCLASHGRFEHFHLYKITEIIVNIPLAMR